MNFFKSLFIMFSFMFGILGTMFASAPALDLSRLDPQEREMMEMVQNLNPEEQQQFFMDIMQELEKVVDKLPPGEQEKFLEEFWSEVEREAAQLEEKIKPVETMPEEAPAPYVPASVQEAKPAAKPAPSSKIESAIAIIDNLLAKLEKIISKSALIPDFPIKVSAWLKQGEIQPSFDRWETLKYQIELLIQQLSKMKDRDPKTKEYKYLPELIKNEVVLNNLSRVESVLKANEPNIQIPEFGSTVLTEKSSAALKKSLSCISEAFYKLGLPASLDSIIEKYAPTAAKLSEEKAKSIQDAQQQNKAARPVTQTVVAGYEAPVPQYSPAPKRAPSYGGGYGEPSLYQPSYNAGIDNSSSSNNAGIGGSSAAPKAGGAATPAAKPAEAPKKEMPKPVAGESKKEDEKKKEEDKRTEKSFENLSSALDKVTDTLIDNNFKNIQTLVLGPTKVNTQAANALQGAINAIDRATDKARALRLRVGKFSPEQKKYYAIDIDELLQKTKTIDSIIKQIDVIKGQEATVSADKQWAFFGGKQIPQTADLTQLVPMPASVYTLQKSLKELLDALRSIR